MSGAVTKHNIGEFIQNYLEYARFEHRESIFEEVNPRDDFSWK
jgi:hypothetical protein